MGGASEEYMPPTPSKLEFAESQESDELVRTNSSAEFKRRGADNLLKALRSELEEIEKTLGVSESDMQKFSRLFSRYLSTRSERIDWGLIKPPPPSLLINYSEAVMPEENAVPGILSKLAVLKLNGGLGTSMGCVGPKSAIEVRDQLNFLDLSVRQIEHLNASYKTKVPLILMNSFNTEKQTTKLVGKYGSVWTFKQSAFPRIYKDTLLPVLTGDGKDSLREGEGWYPPGHGDVFESLRDSGMLDKLISEGKEYLFISNIDNLKATVDLPILSYIEEHGVEFLMEVTEKTRADIKGGTLIEYDGKLRLLELAQVPEYHKTDFTSVRKFKIFNTNSVWVSIRAIQRVLEKGALELEVIENKKKLSTGEDVIQLETALGAAIRYFKNSRGMVVPRLRFLPVKTCSDLFLVQSNLYKVQHGTLVLDGDRATEDSPIIKLASKWYKTVEDFKKRVMGPILITDLDHLTVSGNVTFGKNVTLKGTVIIISSEGNSIYIPDGSILDDKIIHGNLTMLDH